MKFKESEGEPQVSLIQVLTLYVLSRPLEACYAQFVICGNL